MAASHVGAGRANGVALTPATVPHLQRLAGNRAVAALVQRANHKILEEDESEPEKRKAPVVQRAGHKITEEEESEPEKRKGPVVQRNGGKKATVKPDPTGTAWVQGKHVAVDYEVARPSPKRSNSASSTTSAKVPSFKGEATIDAASKVWRYQVTSVKSKGKIQIVYYSKSHYPAPTPEDDSGALSNVTKDNHADIVNDLKANRTGIADDWSAYRAEVLHEDYHWNTEWKGATTPKVRAAETDIEALSVPFAKASTASKAKSGLESKAKNLFKTRMNEGRANFNALGDDPGDPPYIAQAPAIDSLVNRVEQYATTKGW